jgi:zinc/manganese transport system substrate-binding protein
MLTRRAMLATALCTSTAVLIPMGVTAQELKIPVVASFSILGDLVTQIGGDRIALTILVKPGGDAHVYLPTPADAKTLGSARLIVANGLSFEGWMKKLVQASASKVTLVEAARGIKGRTENKAGHGHDHGHAAADPHAWQSVANTKIYVANIRDALIATDAAGKALYEANAARYLGELDRLDADIKAAIAKIIPDRRKIITSHDAFGYFAEAYGLSFIAPRGVSTEAEASAKDVARIIQQIKKEKITAVFIENIADQRLIQQIAKESGASIGGKLFSDSLSVSDGPAPTYIEMMRHNIRAISEALVPKV